MCKNDPGSGHASEFPEEDGNFADAAISESKIAESQEGYRAP